MLAAMLVDEEEESPVAAGEGLVVHCLPRPAVRLVQWDCNKWDGALLTHMLTASPASPGWLCREEGLAVHCLLPNTAVRRGAVANQYDYYVVY